jgi:AcrR family transcriptional regulator
MLRVGASLLRQKGVAGLSVREVAKKAKVNLGMFNYHFKDKNEFIKILLEDAYSAFIAELKKNQANSLEEVLFSMAKFSRNHHQSVLSLINDALSGEKNVVRFLQKNFTTHFAILFEVLKKYFKENGYKEKHIEHAFRYLVSTIGLPNILLGFRMKMNPKLKLKLDSDEHLRRRVQAAISGLEFICKAD